MVLLDTDACIEIIRGNPAPLEVLPESAACILSAVSQFEILSGLRKKGSPKREERARAFLDAGEVYAFDGKAASEAAGVRIYLETKGQSIGAYDLMLAGHALALGVPLLTGNIREFKRIPGLELISWRNEVEPG